MEVMARLLAAETFSHTVAGRYMETLPFRISYSYCLTLFAGFRINQCNGLHPDFKRKDGYSLWLGKDEKWVLPKLEGLQFDNQELSKFQRIRSQKASRIKIQDSREDSIKISHLIQHDLVQNYANWWDNRLNKRNAKAPDFKHKETSKGLWLDSSSKWVLEKLPPPMKPKQSVDTERTLVS
ncbi:Protein OSB2, chloroplastic [Glycine soja]|uniref:Protein OSB2, chloroplastic n=1 Tax=Glycine soja TaxID=3848 RepID=A0A0B2Q1K4_GLYSO|nr:Protein OSB2, chloroplastic [Glycine soja]